MLREILLNRNIMSATYVSKKPLGYRLEEIRTIKINCDNTFYLIQCIQNIITLIWDRYKNYFKMIHKVPCMLCAKDSEISCFYRTSQLGLTTFGRSVAVDR